MIELPLERSPVQQRIRMQRAKRNTRLASGATAGDAQVRAFLQESRKRWMVADSASRNFREAMRNDQRFAAGMGNQWDVQDRTLRTSEGRPCLEINRIPQFIRQVANQNRANRSAIQVHARGYGATKDVATAVQGIIRGIETESDADVAYDTASDHQLISGLGFVRLRLAWANHETFETVPRIQRVRNPLAVYWDPSTQEADFDDCRWMHVIGAFLKEEYNDRWGEISPLASLTEMLAGSRDLQDWMPDGKVMVAEYIYTKIVPRLLLALDNNKHVWREELDAYRAAFQLGNPGVPVPQVVRQRTVQKREVYWCLHNGIAILEGNADRTEGRRMPGERIPIFPVVGTEIDMDGEVDYRGMTRDAIDPQKMYNYWSSSIAEAVALAPKAPWVAAKGQIERYMNDWASANRVPKAVLFYDPVSIEGVAVAPPQRNVVEPAIQAMVHGLAEANQDLMSVMGLFEPSLGQRTSSTESGKARQLLQNQGVIANSNYLDNLQRAKRSIGRCLVAWIPEVYDTPRKLALNQPDGKKQDAVVYAGAQNKPADHEFGDVSDVYDVSVGHYDVAIDTGPSYQTQKQATEAWLLELFKVLPGMAAIGADIVLENSDDPAAKQLAARARKALPPQFQDENDPDAQVPILQSKVAQQQKLLDLAHQAIAAMAKALDTKELEMATKERVAMIQANATLSVAAAKLGNDRDIAAFDAEFERYQQTMESIQQHVLAQLQGDQAIEQQAHASQTRMSEAENQAGLDASMASHTASLQPPPAPPGAGQP